MKELALVCVSCLEEITVVVQPDELFFQEDLPDHDCNTDERTDAQAS